MLLAACTGSHAQSRQSTWSITPRVGVNTSDVTGLRLYETTGNTVTETGSMDTRRKWGLTAGFDVEGLIHQRFGVAVGVYYSDEGYDHVHLHQISVPVMGCFYVLPGLALKGGVQLNGLTNAQHHDLGRNSNILNSTKTFSVSIPLGASFDFKNVSLDVRYLMGITNFCDVRKLNNADANWKTNSLWLTLGYRFNLYQ